jgi:hypothetical protein
MRLRDDWVWAATQADDKLACQDKAGQRDKLTADIEAFMARGGTVHKAGVGEHRDDGYLGNKLFAASMAANKQRARQSQTPLKRHAGRGLPQ